MTSSAKLSSNGTASTPKPLHKASSKPRRFNLDLSPEAYQDMEDLATMLGGRTKVEVFRLSLGLLKTVLPKILQGEELCLVNRSAKNETRIVMPL